MLNMSFALTTPQVRSHEKDVTRRLGWDDLKPGDRVCAVVKGQGIPKGGKVERICVIECVSNRKEMLCAITSAEVLREGFKCMSPSDFVKMFCKHTKCEPRDFVNRIEFKYIVPEECICFACATASHNGGDDDCACDSSPWFDVDRCGICPHNLACDVPKNPNLYPF